MVLSESLREPMKGFLKAMIQSRRRKKERK
jgi:hypothetical protein